MKKEEKNILYYDYNQDGSCFCLGTENGYIVYCKNPINGSSERILGFGVYLIAMLDKTNILGLVRQDSKTKLLIYDDNDNKIITEIDAGFKILNVKLKRNYIFIIGSKEIKVFDLNTFRQCDNIKTYQNDKGIIAISYNSKRNIIVFPYESSGKVSIKDYDLDKNKNSISKYKSYKLHDHNISILAMDKEGKLYASASEDGKKIRLWKVSNNEKINEFQRGSSTASVSSISFSNNSNFLAISSNSSSIHIYKIDESSDKGENKSLVSSLINIVSSSDFAFYSLSDYPNKKICFDPDFDNCLTVFTSNGKYFYLIFDRNKGGECKKELEEKYLTLNKENID